MTPEIERILNAANLAPSGENCQPWHFVVRGLEIEVHLLPARDQSAYSWGQRASYLANGAAIENMVIAASAEHFRAGVTYFPHQEDKWHVATIVLVKDTDMQTDALAPFVSKRISNRKSYEKEPLTNEERNKLLAAASETGYGSLVLAEKKEDIKLLGRVGSTNEEVMLTNRSMHQFFFSHVSWTEEEDQKKKVGFYIKTLELPPPAVFMFKIFRHWSIMRVLSALGFNRIVAMQNGATNASAAAIGAFLISDIEPLDFVKIGRTIERVWIAATALGLSFQALAGIPYFKFKIAGGEGDSFSEGERKLVVDADQKASRIFNADGKYIAFMFRIGRGDAPSAHAVRFPLADVVTVRP
jgi:nitroreductase